MSSPIEPDKSHTDLSDMIVADDGLLQEDILERLDYLYGLYQALENIPPTILMIHPSDYERFVSQVREEAGEHFGENSIDWFESAAIKVHTFIPRYNYYFA